MGRIPIKIIKIKVDNPKYNISKENEVNDSLAFLFTLEEKGLQWQKTFICGIEDLFKLRNEIDRLIKSSTTAEVFKLANDRAEIIDEHYESDPLCQNCAYKLTNKCQVCLFVLQSPLERKLYLELFKAYIKFQPQYALNWQGQAISIEGKTYNDVQNNFKNVLTIVDFFIEKQQTKLCVYTDGHTYHERTEEQAQRDRNIDRKLQELGFQVLRYTGKDVKENVQKIIDDVKKWID